MSTFDPGISLLMYTALRAGLGNPTATLVEPVTTWLPTSGKVYNAHRDRFETAGGDEINPATIWTTETLDILPGDLSKETVALIATGEIADGSIDVFVYGSGPVASVRTAFRIIVDGVMYVVREVIPEPADDPQWARVRLEKL